MFLNCCGCLADWGGAVAGEYCYLKNNTGTVQTWGQPTLFSSAMLYVGGED